MIFFTQNYKSTFKICRLLLVSIILLSYSAFCFSHGSSIKKLGAIKFKVGCEEKIQGAFELGLAYLHSFEYDEARRQFNEVVDQDPKCAMAHWGIAMSYLHLLWAPQTPDEYTSGLTASEMSSKLKANSLREKVLINAINAFYHQTENLTHFERLKKFEAAMESAVTQLPNETEVVLFYALSLVSTADLQDKTFKNQREAGILMNKLLETDAEHPGLAHYIIHAFDSPELAKLAIDAADQYSLIAPSSAHALHMPSHIYTRLGMWEDSIKMNLRSTQAARDYAKAAGIEGHWDEELHGLDYLAYAYLQVNDPVNALAVVKYVAGMQTTYPMNLKVAYAFSAIPARYALERKDWQAAANLSFEHPNFPWSKYPWEMSITHFSRGYGKARLKDIKGTSAELLALREQHGKLLKSNLYQAKQVNIQIHILEAWIHLAEKDSDRAIKKMQQASTMELSTDKHPVTPGSVLPATEILGDMYSLLGKYDDAFDAYEKSLENSKVRRNSIIGALTAAKKIKNEQEIQRYQLKLASISNLNIGAIHLPKSKIY